MLSPLRLVCFLALTLSLAGCGLNDWANQHMPVIGERCDNWQCFTSSGREQSERNLQQDQLKKDTAANAPSSDTSAAPTSSTPSAPPASSLPPSPPEGAYQYVPRAPAPPGTTPYEGHVQ